MSRLYAKKLPLLQTLFLVLSVMFLTSCGMGFDSSPWSDSYNTGVVTRNPDVMPDIRWQTPKQREEVQRRKREDFIELSEGRLLKAPARNETRAERGFVESADITSRLRKKQLERRLAHSMEENRNASSYAIVEPAQQQPLYRKVKVHILLPLSGDKSELGASMLNAAQMALFDVGSENFELVPVDTRGTKQGAIIAARQAVNESSDLILGPIFSANLKAIKPIISDENIPVISFTNDWKLADKNTYIMGFLPFTQVARVVRYANRKGYSRFAAYAPKTEYCDIVLKTLKRTLSNTDAQIIEESRYAAKQRDISSLVQDFVERNKIMREVPAFEEGALPAMIKSLEEDYDVEKEEEEEPQFDLTFDALILPMGGESLKSIINQLEINSVDHSKVKYIGTGLWDDDRFIEFPSMFGGWFAAPDPVMRRDFEKSFRDNFGKAPVRIASIAYDATALASVLASRLAVEEETPYSRNVLINPRGFAGIDGIFRFRKDGLNERGLAVLQIEAGNFRVVDRAPTAFILPQSRY